MSKRELQNQLREFTKANPSGIERVWLADEEPKRRVCFIASAAFTDSEEIPLVKICIYDQPHALVNETASGILSLIEHTTQKTVRCETITARAVTKRKGQRQLRCVLTTQEVLEAGATLTDAMKAFEEKKREAKEIADRYKGELKSLQNEGQKQAERFRTKFDIRTVETEETADFDLGRVVTRRKDSGEIIEDRNMLPEESQRVLTFEGSQVVDSGPVETQEPEEAPQKPQVLEGDVTAALKVIRETHRAGAAMIGRKLHLSGQKVMDILDVLTERGYLGPTNGDEPRGILPLVHEEGAEPGEAEATE